MKRTARFLIFTSLLLIVGCASKIKVPEVSGTVLKDGRPVENMRIRIITEVPRETTTPLQHVMAQALAQTTTLQTRREFKFVVTVSELTYTNAKGEFYFYPFEVDLPAAETDDTPTPRSRDQAAENPLRGDTPASRLQIQFEHNNQWMRGWGFERGSRALPQEVLELQCELSSDKGAAPSTEVACHEK
ncbi:hypothetical protein [Pseudomonas batumici]|uniref:hypothetical protein n=1 Tax=Pseudomonas batumici TaxID=226910 RepID=UPI000589B1DD|nr:hypothetical protein [Pseudomonas batumici]